MECVEAPGIMHGTVDVDRIFRERWHMESDGAPETGSLCNTFLWGPPKGMARQSQSQEMARLYANENIKVTKEE